MRSGSLSVFVDKTTEEIASIDSVRLILAGER
jgi:hypothetical protein